MNKALAKRKVRSTKRNMEVEKWKESTEKRKTTQDGIQSLPLSHHKTVVCSAEHCPCTLQQREKFL